MSTLFSFLETVAPGKSHASLAREMGEDPSVFSKWVHKRRSVPVERFVRMFDYFELSETDKALWLAKLFDEQNGSPRLIRVQAERRERQRRQQGLAQMSDVRRDLMVQGLLRSWRCSVTLDLLRIKNKLRLSSLVEWMKVEQPQLESQLSQMRALGWVDIDGAGDNKFVVARDLPARPGDMHPDAFFGLFSFFSMYSYQDPSGLPADRGGVRRGAELSQALRALADQLEPNGTYGFQISIVDYRG